MILDSSAILAIFLQEPGFKDMLTVIDSAEVIGIGAPTVVATSIVASVKLKRNTRSMVEDLLREIEAEIIPFEHEHWLVALDAFLRFGKGRHRAALNFGDCLSYATAAVAGRPLLAKGEDFKKTDLSLA